LFLNEYDTIEKSGEGAASPAKYLQKLKEIQSFPGNANLRMGIGLESHFTIPNLPYMRASLDTLASANVPIWLTEVDVQGNPAQQVRDLRCKNYNLPSYRASSNCSGGVRLLSCRR
jgi:GH35 family endo-1,4-beta-xylanase